LLGPEPPDICTLIRTSLCSFSSNCTGSPGRLMFVPFGLPVMFNVYSTALSFRSKSVVPLLDPVPLAENLKERPTLLDPANLSAPLNTPSGTSKMAAPSATKGGICTFHKHSSLRSNSSNTVMVTFVVVSLQRGAPGGGHCDALAGLNPRIPMIEPVPSGSRTHGKPKRRTSAGHTRSGQKCRSSRRSERAHAVRWIQSTTWETRTKLFGPRSTLLQSRERGGGRGERWRSIGTSASL
jgi:hypothetical protein